jgi:NAD(P)-dependent dehydrogenase (short-subunit alcohol dehydrogenase family)
MLGLQRTSPSLTGRVAVITGGAKGVGAATAQRMLEKDARVAIIDLDQPRAPKLSGPQAITVTGVLPIR